MEAQNVELSERNTIKLIKPIRLKDRVFEELSFREPKARDLRTMNLAKFTFGDLLDLGARLANVEASVVNELSMKDTARLVEVVAGFLGDGLGTPMNS